MDHLVSPTVAEKAEKGSRNAAIDHLRVVLTLLVILHHVAIACGGSEGWYLREQMNLSGRVLLMFIVVNQAFFMGFFFLLSGYYTPPSYDRKGAVRFLEDRLVRLGIPFLAYVFILSPLTTALGQVGGGANLWSSWWSLFRSGSFGHGPLWFAEALLIFSGAYVLWRLIHPSTSQARDFPGGAKLTLVALALGALSVVVRLWVPVGTEIAWLQLAYFPCYIWLFAAGCMASKSRLLERISFAQARPWMVVSAIAVATMPAVLFLRLGNGSVAGGLSSNALFYAFWEPFAAWGIILGMLWAAGSHWAKPTRFSAWLARNAYGAFILHMPVLAAVSLLVAKWPLSPLQMLVVGGSIVVAFSFALAALVGALPHARKVL